MVPAGVREEDFVEDNSGGAADAGDYDTKRFVTRIKEIRFGSVRD
jgi:hypothetical protein